MKKNEKPKGILIILIGALLLLSVCGENLNSIPLVNVTGGGITVYTNR